MLCILLAPALLKAQPADTLNGYEAKISGDEISYFSQLHQFANTALLTRMNGEMPIRWNAPQYKGTGAMVTYELVMGHSTGTSTGDRHFECLLNQAKLFTITTPMHQKGNYTLKGIGENGSSYLFIQEEYDVNGDAFGKLYITIPAKLVNTKAEFTINGIRENSRDWLMIFMYHRGLKLIAQPTSLVTRTENKRQLNLFVDNPYPNHTPIRFTTPAGTFHALLKKGYNKLQFPAYTPDLTGMQTVEFRVNNTDTLTRSFALTPLRNYQFSIIHHSHNDIGYSHLQPEVEAIQNRNIRAAIQWANQKDSGTQKPIWHIESLWAVENFLKNATPAEVNSFTAAVQNGNIVLSANYANVLTGLCQAGELNWMTEYARRLAYQYGFKISNAMITDIPGISRSALQSYVTNHIPYLSLGPNYVQSLPDQGDRVGGVIREQGDQVFYWKPFLYSNDRLLVWTAGKGYSWFHGITDSEKQAAWEKRISEYCNELTEKKYPYDLVQLRYTKNADNGPVDTLLTGFVDQWNKTYSTPQLRIASVNELFSEMEKKYGNQIPVRTGEISPYWEDGAYSTAAEEMQARDLVIKTLALERYALKTDQRELINDGLYLLHKNLVLFHEHTWGAWCSVSDPEIPFTTEQWRIKKQFLDSAQYYYEQLAAKIHTRYVRTQPKDNTLLPVSGYAVDPVHGGLSSIIVNNRNMVNSTGPYRFFEPVYALGINPASFYQPVITSIQQTENSKLQLTTVVKGRLPSIDSFVITYRLAREEKRLYCHFRIHKQKELNKESLHIALPFNIRDPQIGYSTDYDRMYFNRDQLPGSNREFICVENEVTVEGKDIIATVIAPKIALYEVGAIINENKTNGVKTWKTENPVSSTLFQYVLNNYWHTNYKAYQEGVIEFETEITFRPQTRTAPAQ